MDHVINSLLPLTRAEAGVPIIYGDTLFGVLDLQSETVDRFTEAEIELFVSLANQIAIAMRNAALFEDAGKSRERAEQSDRVKSAFLASMSHELRTPLNAIINFSKFLKKEIPGRINDEQRDLIGNIADSGQHLLNLINDVLDMSKIESGALKLYVEQDIDLRNILATAINYTQPILADKPVSLYQDLPETLPLMHGDRKRLLQVFLNIISNACKFTESGSVRISAYAEQDHMTIAIADTGPGIAPEDADAVFTAFKQTDSGLRQGGGTGLGMPICKKLVEAHAGQLWFESESGKGSTFFVKLPLAESTQAEPKAPEKVTQYA
jgi:signal transduction histidine kinase